MLGAGFTLINLLSAETFGNENGTQVFSLCLFAFATSAIFSPNIIQGLSLNAYCYMSAAVAATGLVVLFVLKPYTANHMEDSQESLVSDGETIVQYPPRLAKLEEP